MAIETIVAVQTEDSKYITDFSVTFKQIRIASTQTALTPLSGTGGIVPSGQIHAQGAAAFQGAPLTPIGLVPGVVPPATLPSSLKTIIDASSLSPLTGIGNLFQLQ